MNQEELDLFISWLLAHGSEVLAPTNLYEVLRFTTQDGVAIIFKDADGKITKDRNGAFEVLRCFRKNVTGTEAERGNGNPAMLQDAGCWSTQSQNATGGTACTAEQR